MHDVPSYLSPLAQPAVKFLAAAGTSVWLDDLSRSRLTSGNLVDLRDSVGIVGVTTNPAIFAASIMGADGSYDEQLRALAAQTPAPDANTVAFALAIQDVRQACDVLRPVWEESGGVDGRVSIEVDPRLARDAQGTVEQATQLWQTVDRPNLMIKIPATPECLPAITEVIAAGISVNVTLIFSVDRYREVIDAYMAGLEKAQAAGLDLSTIESVASFFVSRVDGAVDSLLEAVGTEEALELRGKAAVANARLAYEAFVESVKTVRWSALAQAGAHVQRPLWASTSVKNPAYPATLYVSELAGPATVNTMPEATVTAVVKAPEAIVGDTLTGSARQASQVLEAVAAQGVDMGAVLAQLEADGVEKFVASWNELLASIEGRLG